MISNDRFQFLHPKVEDESVLVFLPLAAALNGSSQYTGGYTSVSLTSFSCQGLNLRETESLENINMPMR